MNWEEREERGESAGEAEQPVGGEGEALPVEGDDGKSKVENDREGDALRDDGDNGKSFRH